MRTFRRACGLLLVAIVSTSCDKSGKLDYAAICNNTKKADADFAKVQQNYPGNPSAALTALSDVVSDLNAAVKIGPSSEDPFGLDLNQALVDAQAAQAQLQKNQPADLLPLDSDLGNLDSWCGELNKSSIVEP